MSTNQFYVEINQKKRDFGCFLVIFILKKMYVCIYF